jgi:MFS family permease
MARADSFANIISAFKSPAFRDFQVGRFIAWTGSWTFRLALSWLVWEMTHSSVWLGMIAFVNFIPAAVISPFAGVLADRMDRVRVLYVSQFLLVIHGILLSTLVTFDLITIELLAAFSFFHGVVDSAQAPATHAVVPALVPQRDLTAAYGINSLSFNLTRFIGPALGGIIVSTWGSGPALLCNAIGSAVFFLVLLRMDSDTSEIKTGEHGHLLKDVLDGVRYAARHEGIGPILTMIIMLAVLVYHLQQFLPAFADPIFHGGANGLAWLISFMGIGAMAQGIIVARRGEIVGLTRSLTRHLATITASVLLLVATDIYWVGLLAMFLIGFSISGTRVTGMTLIQHSVSGEMRGRVVSFYTVVTHVGPGVGALIMGAAAAQFGIRVTFACAALLCLGVLVWVFRRREQMEAALEPQTEES